MDSIKALIIDDAQFMRATLKKILNSYGIEVVGEAENGLRGVEMYAIFKPSLVIMDIAMPVMDGIEATKRIMKINSDAHILVCSTLSERQKVIEAIKVGAFTYILKPPDEKKLISEIENIFNITDIEKQEIPQSGENNSLKPKGNTDYELGYRSALIDVARRLLKDNMLNKDVCSYVDLDEATLNEELNR